MGLFSGLKIKKLQKSIEKYPEIFKNYRDLVEELLKSDEQDEVLTIIQRAREQSWSGDEIAWFLQIQLKIQRSRGQDLAILQDAVELASDESVDPRIRAETAMLCGRILKDNPDAVDDAVEHRVIAILESAESCTEDSLQKSELLLLLSEIDRAAGEYKRALDRLDTIMTMKSFGKRNDRGTIGVTAGKIARTVLTDQQRIKAYFTRALDTGTLNDSDTIDVLIVLSGILKDSDDLLGAMEKLETALRFLGSERSKRSAEIQFAAAEVYLDLGRVPQAFREAGKALEIEDVTGDFRAAIHRWFGQARWAREEFEQATSDYDLALTHVNAIPLKINILAERSDLAGKAGDPESAVDFLTNLLTIPEAENSPLYRYKLVCAYNAAHIPHKALKLIQQLKKEEPDSREIPSGALLREEAAACLKQNKTLRALEIYLDMIESLEEDEPVSREAVLTIQRLKRELSTPEGLKKSRIEGPDRKRLTSILNRIPDEDDLFTRLKKGLQKTKSGLIGGIEKILSGRSAIDEDVIDELEELLILSDLGVETTDRIMSGLREKLRKKELTDGDVVRRHIRSELESILINASGSIEPMNDSQPYVITVVGVNGVGKTTTIAKIAKRFQDSGKSVLLAAGDTFRAGAIEQLKEWGRRLEIDVISQSEGSDPSAVAWDAVAAAKSRDSDILIIDTAGRLHTKLNLMEELKKVHRVIGKNMAGAPHEILLVLDATTGQNAIIQAKLFKEAADVTGIALTKLDGTAKGGIIIGIVQALDIPVKLIGIGESMDDLKDFDAEAFTAALFEE